MKRAFRDERIYNSHSFSLPISSPDITSPSPFCGEPSFFIIIHIHHQPMPTRIMKSVSFRNTYHISRFHQVRPFALRRYISSFLLAYFYLIFTTNLLYLVVSESRVSNIIPMLCYIILRSISMHISHWFQYGRFLTHISKQIALVLPTCSILLSTESSMTS